MELKTRDIWQSAYILSKGAELEEIRPSDDNRIVTFIFKETPETYRLKKEFTSGQGECNISRLRASMIHLKQEVFELIGRS